MAIVDDFTPAAATPSAAKGYANRYARRCRAGLSAFFAAIAAGWRAAADYRRLSEMSDRQLGMRGLSRNDIPQELHARHFGSLRYWLDGID